MKAYTTADVTSPQEGYTVVLDSYWLCQDGDPQKAVFFQNLPVRNKDRKIPERLLPHTEKATGWDLEVVHLEVAYRRPVILWGHE